MNIQIVSIGVFSISLRRIPQKKAGALDNRVTADKSGEEVNQEFDRCQEGAALRLQETLCSSINDFVKSAGEEVIGISCAQFYFLRDGGVYINEQTGEEELFEGKLFDAVVFNDSVREFLN